MSGASTSASMSGISVEPGLPNTWVTPSSRRISSRMSRARRIMLIYTSCHASRGRPILLLLAFAFRLADSIDRDDAFLLVGVEYDDALGRPAGDSDAGDRDPDELT